MASFLYAFSREKTFLLLSLHGLHLVILLPCSSSLSITANSLRLASFLPPSIGVNSYRFALFLSSLYLIRISASIGDGVAPFVLPSLIVNSCRQPLLSLSSSPVLFNPQITSVGDALTEGNQLNAA